MQLGILGSNTSWYVNDLKRAAEDLGYSTIVVPFSGLSNEIGNVSFSELEQCNGIIVRSMPPGSLEQVIFRMDWLTELHQSGIPMINPPKALEAAIDKYLSLAKLHREGLTIPQTFCCETSDDALEKFEELDSDVVVKPIFGSEGRGIMRVSDRELAWRTFRTLERTQSVLLLQQYIDHGGADIRILILDGEVLGGIRRSHPTDFRTNVAQSATAEKYTPGEQEITTALTAANVIEARFAGVDLVYGPDGTLYVLEVNGVPGWRAFAKATGIDVAEKVCRSAIYD